METSFDFTGQFECFNVGNCNSTKNIEYLKSKFQIKAISNYLLRFYIMTDKGLIRNEVFYKYSGGICEIEKQSNWKHHPEGGTFVQAVFDCARESGFLPLAKHDILQRQLSRLATEQWVNVNAIDKNFNSAGKCVKMNTNRDLVFEDCSRKLPYTCINVKGKIGNCTCNCTCNNL